MKTIPDGFRRCLVLLFAFALTARAANPQPPSQTSASNIPLVYVGLFNAQAVNIYSGSQLQLTQTLVDGLYNSTGGIAVDSSQHVYIVTGAGIVVVYPRGGVVPSNRYQFLDQYQPPLTLGINVGSDGTLYAPLWGAGVVAEYPKGDTMTSSLTIPAPSGTTVYATAVDSQNNLYIEYGAAAYPNPGFIEKCPPGSTVCTDLGIVLGAPGFNLVVDSQNNLIACDELAAQIDVFPPGGTQPRVISQGLSGCGFFALNRTENLLFVANQVHAGGSQGAISIFNYATGALVKSVTTGIPSTELIEGIAVSPAP
jgi:hypothetical protein